MTCAFVLGTECDSARVPLVVAVKHRPTSTPVHPQVAALYTTQLKMLLSGWHLHQQCARLHVFGHWDVHASFVCASRELCGAVSLGAWRVSIQQVLEKAQTRRSKTIER